jgi:hypothetical protein
LKPEIGIIGEIFIEQGVTKARVTVGRSSRKVVLLLLMDAFVGDRVMMEGDLALAKVGPVVEPAPLIR